MAKTPPQGRIVLPGNVPSRALQDRVDLLGERLAMVEGALRHLEQRVLNQDPDRARMVPSWIRGTAGNSDRHRDPNNWVREPWSFPFTIASLSKHDTLDHRFTHFVSQDYVFVVHDVCASRDDITVELRSGGQDRIIASVTGPWLCRREVELAAFLQVAYDAVGEGRKADAVELIKQALNVGGGLECEMALSPNDTLQGCVTLNDGAPEGLPANVWIRCVRWRFRG